MLWTVSVDRCFYFFSMVVDIFGVEDLGFNMEPPKN